MAIKIAEYEGDKVSGHKVSYEGRVVATGEKNGYDDSDFYAVVAEADGSFKEVFYASTRYYTYDNSATVDASDDLLQAYRDFLNYEYEKKTYYRQLDEQTHVKVGKRVKIVRGRKYPKGLEGVAVWVGQGYRYDSTRVGMQQDDGTTIWVDGRNVEAVVGADGMAVWA